MSETPMYDVAIVGGGPAGSTLATLLRKYGPNTRVLVLEREKFPRDHVGESQLPPVTRVLTEMGAWDKIEAAGFPIKIGAMYRWGTSDDLFRFDFLPGEELVETQRPGKLGGQRSRTTFHVERSIFDKILLDHAAEYGAEVREETRVTEVLREGDRITGFRLDCGEVITAHWYIDASGHTGLLRRAMGVEADEPTKLKNIAIWEYWRNPKWVGGPCSGGTRVRVLSLGFGWIWFIPLADDRASIGLVTGAEYYKSTGLRPEELYERALQEEPNVRALLEGANREGRVQATKDWSFVSKRMVGENWFLVGEAAGFADPILAAGMTLAMVGSRELAHYLLALQAGEHDPDWIKNWYETSMMRRVGQHIRFADYWYSANAHFSELKQYTTEIAKDAGLDLSPDKAFQWLGTGGFVSDDLTSPVAGTYQLGSAKLFMQIVTQEKSTWQMARYNEFRMNLAGAEQIAVPFCRDGKVESVKCYRRGSRLLPMVGMYRAVVAAVSRESDAQRIAGMLRRIFEESNAFGDPMDAMAAAVDAMEGMIVEGWISAKVNKKRPFLNVHFDESSVAVEKEPVG